MCPDPALLVAYLDGTLFHRDAAAIDKHLETCAECTALLASMRAKREEEHASKTMRARLTIAAAIVAVSTVGYGLWAVLPRSEGEAIETAPDDNKTPPASPVTELPALVPAQPSAPTTPVAPPKPEAPKPEVKTRAETPRQRQQTAAPGAAPATAPRRANATLAAEARSAKAARVIRRTQDQAIVLSTDGGMTWATEHTADRPIRASVFLDEHVAWVVGDSGLVLRRTKNGWFGASPPDEGNITAVKASSPSRATVTLEDGRVFTTANGGVTWSAAP